MRQIIPLRVFCSFIKKKKRFVACNWAAVAFVLPLKEQHSSETGAWTETKNKLQKKNTQNEAMGITAVV